MQKNFDHFVPVLTIEKWEDFDNLFRGCGPVVFRGQGDCTWDLKTNYARTFGLEASRESSMLYRCIAEGHLFVEHPPEKDDYVSWLAEMQHYEASTRLLDVSRSKYVALFMALMGMKDGERTSDGAVWAFDTVRADKVLYDELKENMPHIEVEDSGIIRGEGIMPYQDDGWKIANAAIGCEPAGKITSIDKSLEKCKGLLAKYYEQGMVVHVVPRRTNRRLVAQQGEFLFPFNIKRSFVQNLLGPIGGGDYGGDLCAFGDAEKRSQARSTVTPNVIKAIIPYSLRAEFIDRLIEMNITYQTLFPDEMGFMKSLQYQRDRSRSGLRLANNKETGLTMLCNEFLL